ncbi:MAG: hypothetical protein AAFP15_16505 [Bacteroidota bacterium]
MEPEIFLYFILPALGAVFGFVAERRNLTPRIEQLEALEIERATREGMMSDPVELQTTVAAYTASVGELSRHIDSIDHRLKLIELDPQ